MNSVSSSQHKACIKSSGGKPVILTFLSNYLPGFKAGGILRTIVNTVDFLGDEFEFLIVTQDRDLLESTPYPGITIKQWQPVGGASVYYLPPRSCTIRGLAKLLADTPHDILYLNSFFDSVFTIKLLLARKMGWLPKGPVILAPRGELVEGPLMLKYSKKITYILLSKLLDLYRDIVWQASSDYEAQDFVRVMSIKPDSIHVALDLPSKILPGLELVDSVRQAAYAGDLRIVFLSRLTREKNLDYALKILNKVTKRVVFDIYGPAEDATYWKECRELINRLPANVTVNYLGGVNPDQVLQVLSRYDLFFFPTTGENYGHVIAEALTAGTPVLISNETPWRNLRADGFGWDLSLAQMESFVTVIEEESMMSPEERLQQRALIKGKIMARLLDPAVLEANRQLFRQQLTCCNQLLRQL
jgi:glycosyltransferase involved in cell wall biosynthesis